MSLFVTAIAYYPDKEEYNKPYKCMRVFGHYFDIDGAKNAVSTNYGNMNECLYNYLVIEDIGFGIHALAEKEWWYRFSDQKNGWVKIKRPEWAGGTINWAIG